MRLLTGSISRGPRAGACDILSQVSKGLTRRQALVAGSLAAGSAAALVARPAGAASKHHKWERSYSGRSAAGCRPAGRGLPTYGHSGGSTLPFKIVDGVKVFHLTAEEVDNTFAPGLEAKCWGYNGECHGPTIEAVEGDRVRIYVTNKLEAPTTVHWHGLFLPNGMDGVGGLTQRAIGPGETFKYEWTLRQHGTFMYHSHHDEMTQMAMGMMGMIVIHPRRPPPGYAVDRDFVIMLGEWKIDPGTKRPDPNEMTDFNILTMNAKDVPGDPAAGVQDGGSGADPARESQRDGSSPDPLARLLLQGSQRQTAGGSPRRRSGPRPPCSSPRAARGTSSSWPTRRGTGRCTAT